MKINRHKRVTKYLSFFSNNFGFRKPYQVLIDGTFCYHALQNKVNIRDQLHSYLGTDVKLLTTKCVIIETELLGKHLHGTMLIVKQFNVHRCNHDNQPLSGSACFKSMIADKSNRYIIATQDRELQDVARSIAGTPILYLHQKTPTLDEPSEASLKAANDKTVTRFGLSKFDEESISQLKGNYGLIKEEAKRKKKNKGGPNPLSCKKAKKKNEQNDQVVEGRVKKRKRHRIKIPEHVKAELYKNQ